MSISFGHTYKAVNPTSVNKRNCPKVVIHLIKILQKNDCVEKVWPANLALFVYVSTYTVETVK